MNVLVGSRVLYGLVASLGTALVIGRGRRSRRQRRRAAAHTFDGWASATAVTPSRLSKRQLRALAIGGTDVRGYDLRRARLAGLTLAGIDLSGMDLTGASLRTSSLIGADLRGAILDQVDLSGCDLRDADLSGASLLETDFAGADLRGANIGVCHQIAMVNLRGARFDRRTEWPAGIDPIRHGAIREP